MAGGVCESVPLPLLELARPRLLITPGVRTHHKDLYGCGLCEVIFDSPKKEVIPVQRGVIGAKRCRRPEIDITDFSANACMATNGDKKLLEVAGRFAATLRTDADVVAQ